MKIIFAGTPEFAATHLDALLQSDHEICAVYTQPDRPSGRGKKLTAPPVKQLALEHDIPVLQPKTLRDDAAQKTLASLEADLMVVVAYGLILPQGVLDMPAKGCINVHASLLPRWRGAAPIQQAILSGDKQTGVTIMQMAAGLDTGDMLYTIATDIHDHDTGSSLHDRLAALGANALIEALDQLDQLKPEKQDDTHANYAHKINKADAQIDWQKTTHEIDCMIRAYNAWPVAFTQYQQQVIRIWTAQPILNPHHKTPGIILSCDKTGLLVSTIDGALLIDKIQIPGSRAMAIKDILNGNKITFNIGDSFYET